MDVYRDGTIYILLALFVGGLVAWRLLVLRKKESPTVVRDVLWDLPGGGSMGIAWATFMLGGVLVWRIAADFGFVSGGYSGCLFC